MLEEFAKMQLFQLIHHLKQCRSQHLCISAHCVQSLAEEQTQDIGQIQLLSSSLCPGSRLIVLSALSFFATVQSAKRMPQVFFSCQFDSLHYKCWITYCFAYCSSLQGQNIQKHKRAGKCVCYNVTTWTGLINPMKTLLQWVPIMKQYACVMILSPK